MVVVVVVVVVVVDDLALEAARLDCCSDSSAALGSHACNSSRCRGFRISLVILTRGSSCFRRGCFSNRDHSRFGVSPGCAFSCCIRCFSSFSRFTCCRSCFGNGSCRCGRYCCTAYRRGHRRCFIVFRVGASGQHSREDKEQYCFFHAIASLILHDTTPETLLSSLCRIILPNQLFTQPKLQHFSFHIKSLSVRILRTFLLSVLRPVHPRCRCPTAGTSCCKARSACP